MSDVRPPTSMSHEPPDGGGDAYLWDRSGPADAGVREVEEAARVLRHVGEWASVEAKSRGMRMAKVRALAAAAVVVLALVGAWMMWPSGRITRDSGELSPWKFVAGPGVTVTRTKGDVVSGQGPVVRLATDATSTVQLNSASNIVATLGPNSIAWFEEDVPRGAPKQSPLISEAGELTIENSSESIRRIVAVEGVSIGVGGVSTAKIWRSVDGSVWMGIVQGSGTVKRVLASKSEPPEYALVSPLVVRLADANGTPGLLLPAHPDASAEFVEMIEKWRSCPKGDDGERVRAGLLQRIAEIATQRDVGTLWYLAFEGTYFETEREPLIAAIGRLTGEWPAVIKTTKEPPWSETFKDAWWGVVKRSYEKQAKQVEPPTEPVPPPPSDGKLKAPPVEKGGKK